VKTREDLIRRALGKLGVLAAGQQPSAEDQKLVGDEIGPLLSDLSIRGIYTYGSDDEFEDEVFTYLATCLAVSMASDFGVAPDFAARLDAEARLRDIAATVDAGDPIRANYF